MCIYAKLESSKYQILIKKKKLFFQNLIVEDEDDFSFNVFHSNDVYRSNDAGRCNVGR